MPTHPNAAVEQLSWIERDGGVSLEVHVKPRASRTKVLGIKQGALEVAVSAPPVDGAANEAVCAMIAALFGTAKGRVSVVGGAASRHKRVAVQGIDKAAASALLCKALGAD